MATKGFPRTRLPGEPEPVFPDDFYDWDFEEQEKWLEGFLKQAWSARKPTRLNNDPMKISIGKAAELSALLAGNVDSVEASPHLDRDAIEAFWGFIEERMRAHGHHKRSNRPLPQQSAS